MRWLAYALFCEGSTDRSYYESLLPRVMEYLLTRHKTHDDVDVPPEPSVRLGAQGREVDAVAREACDAQGAFDMLFVHADTGGRSQHARIGSRSSAYCMRMRELCDMPVERCILVQPRHETEAWAWRMPMLWRRPLGTAAARQISVCRKTHVPPNVNRTRKLFFAMPCVLPERDLQTHCSRASRTASRSARCSACRRSESSRTAY